MLQTIPGVAQKRRPASGTATPPRIGTGARVSCRMVLGVIAAPTKRRHEAAGKLRSSGTLNAPSNAARVVTHPRVDPVQLCQLSASAAGRSGAAASTITEQRANQRWVNRLRNACHRCQRYASCGRARLSPPLWRCPVDFVAAWLVNNAEVAGV